jgi:glycosyltransferase involved in cell wall biosynthesis
MRRATKVIVLTEFLKNMVHENLVKDVAVKVIPRGVDAQKFTFQEREIGAPLRIIHVGYLHPVKDQEMLLETFARVNKNVDSVLTIIGDDFMGGRIQKKAEDMMLRDKVIFERHISNDAMPSKYAEADLMLHTSLFESQAVVVNEALACGLLTCGTRVGLLSDLRDSCCLTVTPGDAEGLAKLVLRLLKDPEEMKRLRTNGHAWATQHDLHWTALQHIEMYENLLKDFSTK